MDDIKESLAKLLPPTIKLVQTGAAEVLQVSIQRFDLCSQSSRRNQLYAEFRAFSLVTEHIALRCSALNKPLLQVFDLTGKKKNVVAGCRVNSGFLQRKGTFKVVRKGKVVHEGL